MTSKGCAFLMDMGTGKTITTIALAGTLHHRHKITQMLVVCPKSIVDVWEQEFEKFADYPYQLAVLDGTSAKKADTIRYMIGNGLQIIVVNYESCWRLEAELSRWHPDMIVCDESSKIKNPQAKCSKALHRLGKISSYNLILTGTPITNSPLDFFSQYKFLDESIFGGSFYRASAPTTPSSADSRITRSSGTSIWRSWSKRHIPSHIAFVSTKRSICRNSWRKCDR